MKNQIKKLLIFLSAVMMLTVVMCLNVSATEICPNSLNGEHSWYISDRTEVPCASTAWRVEVCSACRAYRTVIGPMVEHEFDDMYVLEAPTCDMEGYGYWYCSDCGEYDEDKGDEIVCIPALGHEWYSNKISCSDFFYFECLRCSTVKTEKNTNQSSHDWVIYRVIKGATCTEDGLGEADCDNECGSSSQIVIPATGHTYLYDWSEILAPSCTGQGVKIKVCDTCSFVNFETLAALGHTDADLDEICDTCLLALSSKADTEDKNEEEKPAETPDDSTSEDITPDDITPEAPEENNKETNVFDFLIEFFNNIMDFLRMLFGMK